MISSRTSASNDRFAIFATLMAVAVFIDHVRIATLMDPLKAATVVAAICVMRWPSSVRLFIGLVVLQGIDLFVLLPWINNLEILVLLLCVTALAVLPLAAHRAGGLPTGAGWLAGFEPLFRLATVIVYALTFWHKLNRDYLASETSCAVHLYELMQSQAWMPGWLLPSGADVGVVLVVTTLAFELAIPVLLAIPATARIGIVVGLTFHYLLGLARFYEFSALAAALLFLFAPPAVTEDLRRWGRGRDWRRLMTLGLGIGALIAILVVVQTVLSWTPSLSPRRTVRFAGHLALGYAWWLSAVPIAIFARILLRLPASATPPSPRFKPWHPVLLACPLLVLLNGLSPYLGFKTENSYAMYSNLRTEGGRTNHLLWTVPAAWTDYQTRLVRIIESSDEELAEASEELRPVPFFDVRRTVYGPQTSSQPVSVVYERDGVTYRVPPAGNDPELSPPSYWELKLLRFRSVHLEKNPCTH